MTSSLKIDFVSDISCPWCAIGLASLEHALGNMQGEVSARLHFQPFELNPQMPAGGQDIGEHLQQKYGSTEEQRVQIRETIRQRGAGVGFTFGAGGRNRIYNTFNAHRLLHWAGEQGAGAQHRLKMALFSAYFTDGQNVADHAALLGAVEAAGLDRAAAAEVLAGNGFAEEVRGEENYWRREGINAVPAVIINGKYMISGGHPAASFEKALRRIAAEG